MTGKIGRLGAETAVYGVSTVIGRFLTFLLTPFYANILPPSDLGVVATLYSYIAFLNVVYHYGMDVSYMKYVSTLELGSKKATFSVPFLSVFASSLLFTAVLWASARSLAVPVGAGAGNEHLLSYSAVILFLDALSHIPFAVLRMERKAKTFAAIKLAGIVVNVVCVVIFLLGLGKGMEGIFLAGIISSAVTLLLLLPTILANLEFPPIARLLPAFLRYGLPTLPAGLAAIVVQVIDRPILESLTDLRTVGIYQANYRLGIFMMLVVSMFEFAWRPFSFAHARDQDAPRLFGRVMTYLLLVMISLFILLLFFLEDIVKAPVFFGYSILPTDYWKGYTVVPLVLLGYVFLGISTVFSAGLYIEKKTGLLPTIAIGGAVINVAANFLLIPRWGMSGAAVATLLSYAAMAGMTYQFARGAYNVTYETQRILRLVLLAVAVCAAGVFVTPPVPVFLWRVLLVAVFFGGLSWFKLFSRSELISMKSAFSLSALRTRTHDESLPGNGN